MLIDETFDECLNRQTRESRFALKPKPVQHDWHVRMWAVEMFELIETLAWQRRQARANFE